MARPSNTDTEQTKATILASSVRLFGERGVHQTSIREVARESGVTLGTVHHHFGTKDELLLRSVEYSFAQMVQAGMAMFEVYSQAAEHERVEVAVRLLLTLARQAPERSRFLLRAFVFESTDAIRGLLEQTQSSFVDQLVELAPWPPGLSVAQRRVAIIGLGALMTRLVVGSDTERALFGEDDDQAWQVITDYILKVAKATISAPIGAL